MINDLPIQGLIYQWIAFKVPEKSILKYRISYIVKVVPSSRISRSQTPMMGLYLHRGGNYSSGIPHRREWKKERESRKGEAFLNGVIHHSMNVYPRVHWNNRPCCRECYLLRSQRVFLTLSFSSLELYCEGEHLRF